MHVDVLDGTMETQNDLEIPSMAIVLCALHEARVHDNTCRQSPQRRIMLINEG
jgi:hypothetical protein